MCRNVWSCNRERVIRKTTVWVKTEYEGHQIFFLVYLTKIISLIGLLEWVTVNSLKGSGCDRIEILSPNFCEVHAKKSTQNIRRTLAEIRTKNVPNTTLERYSWNGLFGRKQRSRALICTIILKKWLLYNVLVSKGFGEKQEKKVCHSGLGLRKSGFRNLASLLSVPTEFWTVTFSP